MYLSFKVHISLWLPTIDLSIKYVWILLTPDNLNLLKIGEIRSSKLIVGNKQMAGEGMKLSCTTSLQGQQDINRYFEKGI